MTKENSLFPNYLGNPQRLLEGYTEGDDTIAGATDYNKHDDELLKHQELIASMLGVTSGSVTRVNGYISSITIVGGKTTTITKDSNNLISSIYDGTYTWTIIRDANNYITSWVVT